MPRIALMAVLLTTLGAPAMAQDFPTRPMTMVIPFAAPAVSTSSDGSLPRACLKFSAARSSSRTSALPAAWWVPLACRVPRPTDINSCWAALARMPRTKRFTRIRLYNSATDFTPVALVAEQPIVLAARKDFPADNLPEFIAYTKAHQDKMQYGSPGTGSSTHLACALFTAAIGVKVTHIPFRNNATQDLIAGRTDYQCMSGAAAVPLIEGKMAKMVATLTRARWSRLPDLASAHEQGLTNFEAYIWYALFLPKGTPAPIVRRLHGAAVQAWKRRVVQDGSSSAGATVPAPDRRSPEYLQRFVESEIAKWAGPIKAAGLAGLQ